MSNQTFAKALHFTLTWEGNKFVDDPDDAGGATRFGITQTTYSYYLKGHNKPYKSVEFITDEELQSIYLSMFWSPSYAYVCDYPLAVALFDTAVQFKPVTFRTIVGNALGVKPTGMIDKLKIMLGFSPSEFMTGAMLQALKTCNQKQVASLIVSQRISFRKMLVIKYPSQLKYIKGWLARDRALGVEVQNG